MDFVKPYKLLMFLCVMQGAHTDQMKIHYKKSVTATTGQNISLVCFVEEEHNITITQVEWSRRKIKETIDQKIVLFHPNMPMCYFQLSTNLEVIYNPEQNKLKGSVLNLLSVTTNDSGIYMCDLASYPYGSIKRTTNVLISEPPPLVKMSISYDFVKEGDDVKITCSASPQPRSYNLHRPLLGQLYHNKSWLLSSLTGEFRLSNVSRNDGDMYVCFPQWDPFTRTQQGWNATMKLTVNFLDSIECNTSSTLKVGAGEDVVISCKTNASQNLQYKWMMGNTSVSLTDTLFLTSVTDDQSGKYKVTAVFPKNLLQRSAEFSIRVVTEVTRVTTTNEEMTAGRSFSTSSFWNLLTEHLSSSQTRMTTASDRLQTSTETTGNNVTASAHTTEHTSHTASPTAPPVGNESTSQGNVQQKTTGDYNNTSAKTNKRNVVNVTVTVQNNLEVTENTESRSKVYIISPLLLLFLGLLLVLLRRRHIRKIKMDMPPPFKPPPPPVKYTSMRSNDVLVTDILV